MPNLYYPAYLDLKGRPCVILGGGREEESKARAFAECGASVTVVSPEVTPGLKALADSAAVAWEPRNYRPEALIGAFVAVVETGDTPMNRDIFRAAQELQVLLNVVDTRRLCIWAAAGLVHRGEVTLAISTGGASPALARKLREGLSRWPGLRWADLAPLLSQTRQELMRQGLRVQPEGWRRALTDELLDLLHQGREAEASQRLMALLLSVSASVDGGSYGASMLQEEPEEGAPVVGAGRYYPVFLSLQDRPCVVVGGGRVAEQKVRPLLESQAPVTVVSPEVTPGLRELAQQGAIEWSERAYQEGDLAGAFIAFAATGDAAVNRQVAAEAQAQRVPANVADAPSLGQFIVPSIVRRGEVIVAISTGGASPALARKLKEELATAAEMAWADLAPLLAQARAELRQRGVRVTPDHWQACLTSDLLALYRGGRHEEAQERLMAALMAQGGPVETGRQS